MKTKLLCALLLSAISPMSLLAQNSWGNQMDYMGNGGGQMGFFGGGWMMILWVALLVLLITGIAKWVTGSGQKPIPTNDAHKILGERYARGEIDRDEFERIRKQLLS